MKKIHVTMIALIACFALTGCGQLVPAKKQTTNTNTNAVAPEKATLTLMTSTKDVPNEPFHTEEDKVLDPIYEGQFGKDYYEEINAPKKKHLATSPSSHTAKDSNGTDALNQKLQELKDHNADRNTGKGKSGSHGSSDEAFSKKLQELKDNAKRIQEKNDNKQNDSTDDSKISLAQKLQELKDKNNQKNNDANTDPKSGGKSTGDAFDKKLQELKDNAKRLEEKNVHNSSEPGQTQAKNNQAFDELLKKLKEKQQKIKDKTNN